MRLSVAAIAICLAIVGISAAQNARAAMRKPTNISAQPLGSALEALAKERDLQVIYRSDLVGSVQSAGAVGVFTPEQALGKLLAGTGLTYRYLNETTVTITQESPGSPTPAPVTGSSTPAPSSPADNGNQKPGGSLWDRFLLAQASPGQTANAPAVDKNTGQARDQKPVQLEEVIVTAQKRDERLQDVPVPVTAISAQTLVATNQLRLQDYYAQIPGLNVTTDDYGAPQVTIRGLATGGYTNPTVGFVVDDVPYGSSSANAYGQEAPDMDPSDLARVEVLRGPQGTLYGANSLGGLIKYVTVDPSTDGVSGRVQAGTSGVHNAAELGYNVRGAVNVPLSDTLAIRASGFTRQDPGYIDNPVVNIKAVNEGHAEGGRLSALWRPSQEFSLKMSALVQHTKIDGSSSVDVEPGLRDLQQSDVPGTGWYDQTLQAYSATVTAKLGHVDLTAVSGYNVNTFSDSIDGTPLLGPYTQMQFGVTGTPVTNYQTTRKFTQEIRLSAPIGRKLEWLLGAFYDYEDSPGTQDILAANFTNGVPVGQWAHILAPSTFAEYAAFADVTFHVTDRFDIQMGGRDSQIRQTATATYEGVYVPFFFGVASPLVYPKADSKGNPFTYLVTPQFKLSSDLMVYARLASGYRAGGPNITFSSVIPPSYKPDTTRNYEIGVKGDFLDRTLSVDMSLYYIQWKDIQLLLLDPTVLLNYTGNAGAAKSQGVEFSVESKPLKGLKIAAWFAWSDAVLTQAFPPTSTAYGAAGDRLPLSSRFSGNLSLDEELSLTSKVAGFFGGSVSYVGDREGLFPSIPCPCVRQVLPAYAKTDLRAGLSYQSWTVNFFVNNLTDKRGLIGGGLGTFTPIAFNYIQPRTIGLSIVKTF